MQQAYGKSVAYWVATGSSATLGGSWAAYLVYMCATEVTKQSVFMGPITAYTGLVLGISFLAILFGVPALVTLAFKRNPLTKRAAVWAGLSLMVMVMVFFITREITDGAI
jgi:hypothetical protein